MNESRFPRTQSQTLDQRFGNMVSNDDIAVRRIGVLAPFVAQIVGSLSGEKLKEATIAAIGKHRMLTEASENAYRAWEDCADNDPRKTNLLENFHRTSLENRSQIAVVAALTEKLGYIPDANRERQ
ncbi:transcriptional repressor TraM [Pelagibacterium sp. H642]|uniref:transcriptional repressor TraM n=1 Tax=Pelagibacterium sp. H642 TaxID=1881069 RepID=UPI00281607F7|nr:transcriptional repressor TraM [Pelagibacterium sp. H642]WMT92556.1 transcriptional repressor TraM [Pelagibacterium sp. H642]